MLDPLYPLPSRDLSETRKRLAPEVHDAFQTFSQKVFAEGALPAKTKQLIAVAVAHVTLPVLHQGPHQGCAAPGCHA